MTLEGGGVELAWSLKNLCNDEEELQGALLIAVLGLFAKISIPSTLIYFPMS